MDFVCKVLKEAYYAHVNKEDLIQIKKKSNGKIKYVIVGENEVLIRYDQELTSILFVFKGSYIVTRHSDEGKVNIIGEKDAPRFLSTLSLTSTSEVALADMTTTVKSELLVIEKKYLLELIQYDPEISLMIIDNLSKVLREDTDRLDQHAFNNSLENFIVYLYYQWKKSKNRNSYPFIINSTNQRIADRMGINVRTFYRTLKLAKHQKLIKTSNKKIIVENEGMKKIIEIAESLIFR